MHSPTISIFLPTYSRFGSGSLQRAIESALAQSREDFELLVVDDGSTDGTAAYLDEQAERDRRIKVIHLPRNTGLPAFALAQAYPEAAGEYLAWLFDDCELDPDHLATLAGALDDDPSVSMVYGRVRASLSSGSDFEIGSPIDLDAMEKGQNVIPNVCVMLRRSVVETTGWYDPHVLLKRLCDWDLWLRIAKSHRIGFVDRVLATEYGVGLPDSLGRVFKDNTELAVRYARTERGDRLHPSMLTLEDCFQRDVGLDLDDASREQLELVLFEHALMVLDLDRAVEAATFLAARTAGEKLLERAGVSIAGDEAPPQACLLVAANRYLRQRVELHAKAEIASEATARAALVAADERIRMLRDEQSKVLHLDEERQNLLAQHAALEEARQGLEQTLRERENALEEQRRYVSQALEQLSETNRLLFVFRDAADRRLELLNSANEEIRALREKASQPQSPADA